jgi:hypothetical protein
VTSHVLVINSTAASGLTVTAALDDGRYSIGVQISGSQVKIPETGRNGEVGRRGAIMGYHRGGGA